MAMTSLHVIGRPVRFTVIVLCAATLPAAVALAGATPLTGTMVQVKASSASGNGTLSYFFPANTSTIQGQYDWSLNTPTTIYAANGTTVLGTVHNLNLSINADPSVSLGFLVSAGSQTTTFDIQSATIGFAPMTNPDAFAHADVKVTDADGSGWARLKGLFSFWGFDLAYEARYNGTNAWADLLMTTTVQIPGASILAEEGRPDAAPSVVRETIFDTVSSIESQFKFTLTAYDTAEGNSVFDVVPEPTTLLLLGAGIVLTSRSRRS